MSNKKLTPMAELIKLLSERMSRVNMNVNQDIAVGMIAGLSAAREEAKSLLPKEKDMVVDSNIAGMEFIPVDAGRYQEDAEQYFNETYKQQ